MVIQAPNHVTGDMVWHIDSPTMVWSFQLVNRTQSMFFFNTFLKQNVCRFVFMGHQLASWKSNPRNLMAAMSGTLRSEAMLTSRAAHFVCFLVKDMVVA